MEKPENKERIYELYDSDIQKLKIIFSNLKIDTPGGTNNYVYDYNTNILINISNEPDKQAINKALGNHIKIFKIENRNINLIS